MTMSLEELQGMLEMLFGLSTSAQSGGTARCTNGAVTSTAGDTLFA
jgi:hypothetical protein